MVWGTENGSSLTFAGTQNSNMSDEGARNNKEVFSVFVNQHPLKPTQTKFIPSLEPQSNNLKPHQTPKLFPNLIVIPIIFCNFAHGTQCLEDGASQIHKIVLLMNMFQQLLYIATTAKDIKAHSDSGSYSNALIV